jgi:hypothetical protein
MTTTPEYSTYGTAAEALAAHQVPDDAQEPEAEKIKLSDLSETLNGFDQIAIRSRFHERFDQLAEDPLMFARAMYFIHLTRQGVKHGEAFDTAMNLPMAQLNDLFDGDDDELDEGDESAVAERDREFADFVIGTGIGYTLEEYMALTIQQRGRMIEAANRR